MLLAVAASGQGVGYGDWQLHLPTSRPKQLADAGDRLYVATEYAFFVLNKSENTTQVLSRREGLSDVGVAALAYDSARQQTVVVYRNNNVDIIRRNGSVRNLNDILRKAIPGTREIFQVYINANRAYIAASFGIVELNLDKLEVSETYTNIGPNASQVRVYATTVGNGFIVAATSVGLLHARLSSNLLDYRNWTVRTPQLLQSNYDIYRSLATYAGNVYTVIEGGDLYRFDFSTGNWQILYGAYTFRVLRLRPSSTGLLIIDEPNGVRRYDRAGNFTQLISPAASGTNIQDAVRSKDGSYYIASYNDGLMQVFPGSTRAPERYTANGPETDKAFSVLADAHSNSVTIFTGGYSDRYNPLGRTQGFYEYKEGQWSNVTSARYPSTNSYPNPQEVSRGTRTPDGTLYVASYNNGLLEWKGPGQFRQFTSSTPGSPILNWGFPNTDRITDVAADEDGNVWVVNRHLRTGISGLLLFKPATSEWVRSPNFVGADNLDRIALDDNGFVWVSAARKANAGQRLGITVLDPATGNTRTFTTADGLPEGEIYDLVKDRDGNIWAATIKGVAVLYGSSGAFLPETVFQTPIVRRGEGSGFPVLFNEAVKAIAVDGGNRKWLGTDRGLWLFSDDAKEALLHFTMTNSPLPSNQIVDVEVNNKTGEVWVATNAGVVAYRGTATVTEGPPSCSKVFPNPVRPGFTGVVGISGVVNNALVKITDVAGHLVYSTKANGGTVEWNLNDSQGQRVRPGVYLVLTSDADGKNGCVSKVAVLSK
ncbi:two-component regulator propeller domain-containing protein [Hymenobacter saemangeumensis]|uniref:Two-component regulator propeller domain-containing protein n=2 Tax=Hymenobacter saemangeumensis TaxID=1084522 RepID=A0ABP8IJR2_9BACT